MKINGSFSRLFGKLFGFLNVQIKLLSFIALLGKMAKAQGNTPFNAFILKGVQLFIDLRLILHSQLGYHVQSVEAVRRISGAE